jgi:hypothetical protein
MERHVTRAFLFLVTMSLRLLHGLCKQNLPVSPQERFLSVLSSHPLHSEPKTFSFRSKQMLGFNFWTPSCGGQRSSSRLDDPYSIGQIKVSLFFLYSLPRQLAMGRHSLRHTRPLLAAASFFRVAIYPSSCLHANEFHMSNLRAHVSMPSCGNQFQNCIVMPCLSLVCLKASISRAHVSTPSCGNFNSSPSSPHWGRKLPQFFEGSQK